MTVCKIGYLRKTVDGYYLPTYFYNTPVLVYRETEDTVTIKYQGKLYTFPRNSIERSI